jgi:hypothetical protein
MQLVAYGAQDIYLTGNAQITFFKVVYRRHTNFAVESVEQTFQGTPGFNKRVTCTISRNGDLISDVFLEVTLTKISANTTKTWWPAEALIQEVELEIGGQRIDKHYNTWLRIYDELFRHGDDAAGYERLVNFTADEQTVTGELKKKFYVPLVFFFNRNPGLALPLIALQYHEVKLSFLFAKTDLMTDCGVKALTDNDMEARLFVDYIFLDVDERKRFAQVSHEYLITQVQHTGDETALVQNTNQNLSLNLNHPCKYLAWVFANPNSHGHFAGPAALRNTTSEFLAPLKRAKLQLNGHDRATERDGSYYNYVQPWQTLRAVPKAGVYMYSFALKPDEHQPSGSCNMSRIDNATLLLTYKSKNSAATSNVVATAIQSALTPDQTTVDASNLTALRLFAENYNVLRIMSGMGGLAYAS